jgi:hypothetical protein
MQIPQLQDDRGIMNPSPARKRKNTTKGVVGGAQKGTIKQNVL